MHRNLQRVCSGCAFLYASLFLNFVRVSFCSFTVFCPALLLGSLWIIIQHYFQTEWNRKELPDQHCMSLHHSHSSGAEVSKARSSKIQIQLCYISNVPFVVVAIFSQNPFRAASLSKHPHAYYCKLKQGNKHSFLSTMTANLQLNCK